MSHGERKELMGHFATARYLTLPTTEKGRVRPVAQWSKEKKGERAGDKRAGIEMNVAAGADVPLGEQVR